MPNGVDYYTNANGDITIIGNIEGRKIIVTPEGVSDTPLHPNLKASSNPDPVPPSTNSNQSHKEVSKPSTFSVNAQAGRHVINIDKLETTGTTRIGGNNGGVSIQGSSLILTRPEQTTRPGEIKSVTVKMTPESFKNEPQIHATYAQMDPKKWVWPYEVPEVNEEIKKYGPLFEDKHFSYNRNFIIQSAAEILESLGYAVHLQLESPKKTVKLPDYINYSFFFLDGDTDFDLGPCFCIIDKKTKQVYALDPIGYFNKSNILKALDLQDFQLVFVTQKIEPKDTLSAGVYVAAVLVDLVRGNFQFQNPLKSMQELINFEEMTQNYQKHSATLLNSFCYAYSKVVEKRNKKKDQISETDSVKTATEKVAEGELAHPKKQQAKPVKLKNKKNKPEERTYVKILNNDSCPENPLKSPNASESEFKPTEELSDCSADNTNKPINVTVSNINKAQEYTFKSIEGHLKMLNTKIGDKKQHHSDSAVLEASALLKALDKNYEQYQNNIKGEMANNVADKKMLEACNEDINKAKKALENDLNWTSYLGNLLKAFANLFIKLINPNRLFAYTKPSSLQSIETCEDGIKAVLSQN